MIENLVEISLDQLLDNCATAQRDGYRFVTASCADNAEGKVELTYHFDKDLTMKNFRVTVTREDSIPSISKIYLCAILVENELKELFGLKITDIAIDYGGHLLLSGDFFNAPLSRNQIVIEQRGAKKDG